MKITVTNGYGGFLYEWEIDDKDPLGSYLALLKNLQREGREREGLGPSPKQHRPGQVWRKS